MTEGSDWQDPYTGDDEAARERERRRAERDARRRERLGERVREEMGTEETPPPARQREPMVPGAPPEPPAAEQPPEAPAEPTEILERPAQATAEQPAPTAEHAAPPPPPSGGPSRAKVARRRLIALVGVLALGFLAFVVVVGAKKLGGDDPPPAPPPKPQKTVSITIPEGYSRDQVAAVAKKADLKGDYMKATESFKGFPLDKYGAKDAENLEGFLFPATYEVFKNAKVEDLVGKQLDAFQQNLDGIDLSYAESKNLTVYDVVKIASMVEREAQIEKDRPNVSSVIYNRLAADMPLGIDATIRFEDSNYDEQLVESRLAEDTPYNTRINTGLPPGPIGNPGLASLEAAANPAKNDYLFFVVKPGTCGEHVFTETEDEFFEAEAEYQAALQAEGGSPTEC